MKNHPPEMLAPPLTGSSPVDRWDALRVAAAGGAGFGLGFVVYPTMFDKPQGIAFWGMSRWASVGLATAIVTLLSNFVVRPRLEMRRAEKVTGVENRVGFTPQAMLSFTVVIVMSTFEHLLHILFENTETIVFWLGGSLAAGAATYLWILSAYSPSLSLLRTGAIAGCAAIFVTLANVFLQAVNGGRFYASYWAALTVVYAVGFGIRVMAGGLAIRRRWAGHPGLGILVSLSTVAIIFYAVILHLPRNVIGDPPEPPRQGLIGQLFMIAGWGIALILHPKSRPVLYGQVEGLWLPGRAWLASFSKRRAPAIPVPLGFDFLFKWTVTSSAAWLLAFYLAFGLFAFGRSRAPNPSPLGSLDFASGISMVFALAALGMSGVQWLFLRNILPGFGWWWVAGNALGSFLAEFGFHVLPHITRTWTGWVTGLTAGLVAGALQLQVLKSSIVRPWRWLMITSLGFSAMLALTLLTVRLGIYLIGKTNGFYAAQVIGVASLAMITGAGLVRLTAPPGRQSEGCEMRAQTAGVLALILLVLANLFHGDLARVLVVGAIVVLCYFCLLLAQGLYRWLTRRASV